MRLKLLAQIPNGPSVVHEIRSTHCVVGREGCDIVIESKFCSKRHLMLYDNREGELIMRDLGSTNGTRLSLTYGEPIEEAVLTEGSKFFIGNVEMTVIAFEAGPGIGDTAGYRYFIPHREEETITRC